MDSILILTPIKDAVSCCESYFTGLQGLTYPHNRISLGLLESDSQDETYQVFRNKLKNFREEFVSTEIWKKDFAFRIPDGHQRWDAEVQLERRTILAKSRNYLLFKALRDQDWVLWLDVDVIEYPPDIIQQLVATGKDIVHPHCVKEYGGKSYDLNAWREKGSLYMHDLRHEGTLIGLHAVGGTMLLVRADVHREGLVFPPYLYGVDNPLVRSQNGFRRKGFINRFRRSMKGEIETEGLGMMAHDMGYECFGMPNLEIKHRNK